MVNLTIYHMITHKSNSFLGDNRSVGNWVGHLTQRLILFFLGWHNMNALGKISLYGIKQGSHPDLAPDTAILGLTNKSVGSRINGHPFKKHSPCKPEVPCRFGERSQETGKIGMAGSAR